MLDRIRDHRYRFPVVLGQNASYLGPEFHTFPDPEIQHDAARPHLAEKPETSRDFVIQHDFVIPFDQIFFGEGIKIEVLPP